MDFTNFAFLVEMEHAYDDYLMDCLDANILPLNFTEWMEQE